MLVPVLSLVTAFLKTGLFLGFYSHGIDQFRSTFPHRKEKRLTLHQKLATSFDKMMMSVKNKVRCDWSPEVPVGP